MKNYERTINEWKELLNLYEKRNGSRSEWCKANNITVAKLKYWQNKISAKDSAPVVETQITSNWLQLSSLDDGSKINDTTTGVVNQSLVIEINGVSIKVNNDFDSNALKQLIGVIKSC